MWRCNGFLLVLFVFIVVFIVGQVVVGYYVYNQELIQYGCVLIDFWYYLVIGYFVSVMFENWESEFLQMGMYVFLMVSLC